MADKLSLEEEKQLIEKAKSDPESFGKLYDMYFSKLYGYVAYMIGNGADAEDIVSETFEKALKHINRFEWRGYTFAAWLFRIARNLVYDRAKKKSTVSFEDVSDFLGVSLDNVEKQVEQRIELEKLQKDLLDLKADLREVIVLRYIEQYSIKETCEITGRSVDSVKSICKRALAALREKKEMKTDGMVMKM